MKKVKISIFSFLVNFLCPMPLGYTVGLIFVIHTPGARHYFVEIVKFTVFWHITQIALPRPKDWPQSQNYCARLSTRMGMFEFDPKLKITLQIFMQ